MDSEKKVFTTMLSGMISEAIVEFGAVKNILYRLAKLVDHGEMEHGANRITCDWCGLRCLRCATKVLPINQKTVSKEARSEPEKE